MNIINTQLLLKYFLIFSPKTTVLKMLYYFDFEKTFLMRSTKPRGILRIVV